MVTFPNCKINIGLHISNKRIDGYHNVQTIFYPLPIKDALEIIEINTAPGEEVIFSSSGNAPDDKGSDNLCVQAYRLIKKDFPHIPNIKIHLHKNIPMGAGLGGGSADAAFMLRLLNEKFNLDLSREQLSNYALQLGSDCPFFIINKPCYATGRGELLQEIELDLSAYKILLVNPGIHINTRWAFSEIKPQKPEANNEQMPFFIGEPPTNWQNLIQNDFEKPVFDKYPEIERLKDTLYLSGALYASMSGSGSSVYGIFEKETAPVLKFPEHYFFKWV